MSFFSNPIHLMLHNNAMKDVRIERERQETLVRVKFEYTCADPTIPDIRKLSVLAEEFGEAARHVSDFDSSIPKIRAKAALREELIQIAAVAVAWVEGLDAED